MNKKQTLYLTVASLVMIGLLAVITNQSNMVFAQGSEEQRQTIIEKLVQKFGLNEDEVKAVFDQEREERQVQMQTRHEQALDQAVKDGRITEAQKTALVAKLEEWQKNRTDWLNKTPEERRQEMVTHKQELETWAKDNGIDIQNLYGFGKGMMGLGRGSRMH